MALSEGLVDPVGGQRREVIGGQLDRPLELAPEVVRLREIGRGQDAESQVPEAPGDLQRAGAGHECLVQLAEQRVGVGQNAQTRPRRRSSFNRSARVSASRRRSSTRGLTEPDQHRPQLEADLEALLQRGRALRQRREDAQRLLEPDPGRPGAPTARPP